MLRMHKVAIWSCQTACLTISRIKVVRHGIGEVKIMRCLRQSPPGVPRANKARCESHQGAFSISECSTHGSSGRQMQCGIVLNFHKCSVLSPLMHKMMFSHDRIGKNQQGLVQTCTTMVLESATTGLSLSHRTINLAEINEIQSISEIQSFSRALSKKTP